MELIDIVLGTVVLIVMYVLWIGWGKKRSWTASCEGVRHRLRSAFGVASKEDLRALHGRLQQIEQQWESRFVKLETRVNVSNQWQYVSQELQHRLGKLEQTDQGQKPGEFVVSRPRSVVRFGLRMTLSDGIWVHLETRSDNKLDDRLVDALIQGPFCLVCLKRLVSGNRGRESTTVPMQCRNCGVSWNDQGAVARPVSFIQLKRQVYEALDQEFRVSGMLRERM